jgi:hypothetical protein
MCGSKFSQKLTTTRIASGWRSAGTRTSGTASIVMSLVAGASALS